MKQKRWNQALIKMLYPISGLLVFNVASVWAQQPRGDYYGPHMMSNGGWFGMFFGSIFMIVFIGIAVAVVVLLGFAGSEARHPGSVLLRHLREIPWTS